MPDTMILPLLKRTFNSSWLPALLLFGVVVVRSTASSVASGGVAGSSSNWTDPTSQVYLHLPVALYHASGVPHVRGEFGGGDRSILHTTPQSLSAHVVYVDQTLCYPLNNLTEGFPTGDNTIGGGGYRTVPFYVLVHGGGCPAVLKARHAQQMGASAVLIGERHCACWDHDCAQQYSNDTFCSDYQNSMVDDGSGADVSIPAILLYRPTYEVMRERLQDQNKPIFMELQWNLLRPVGSDDCHHSYQPVVHFWTLAYDPYVPYDTYWHVARTMMALADYVQFEPRFLVYNGTKLDCRGENGNDNTTCPQMCTNGNRYCALPQPPGAVVTPRHAVEETARRLCLFQTFHPKNKKDGADENTYWQYVLYYKQHCIGHLYGDTKCIEAALQHAGVHLHHDTSTELQHCLDAAGKTGGDDVPNSLLDEAIGHIERAGVMATPTLSINHQPIANIHARDILEAVCDAYWYSSSPTVPPVCETCGGCPNTLGCLENNGKCVAFNNRERHPDADIVPDDSESSGHNKSTKSHSGHGSGWKVFWWLFFLSILAVVIYHGQTKYGCCDAFANTVMAQRQRLQRTRQPHSYNNIRESGILNDYLHLQNEDE
jgi:hypothetical protein